MNFKDGQPIFVQIAERLGDDIVSRTYQPESRVPGVREYAALLEVNVNTVVKAYELLARQGIIYSKRGMGYYVAPDAPELVRRERRNDFRQHTLPQVFRQMRLLGIVMDEVVQAYENEGRQPPEPA